ncbi:hypothetical protein EV681_3574 [Advenella incenata]|uniref:Uncharacterized protein n=1 Tax=Advenella incenata TaxID=267800 RepID=A0A4Q7VBW4_9BURK|nr:hypothetical protein EV681_3574 [Advenella incenata]
MFFRLIQTQQIIATIRINCNFPMQDELEIHSYKKLQPCDAKNDASVPDKLKCYLWARYQFFWEKYKPGINISYAMAMMLGMLVMVAMLAWHPGYAICARHTTAWLSRQPSDHLISCQDPCCAMQYRQDSHPARSALTPPVAAAYCQIFNNCLSVSSACGFMGHADGGRVAPQLWPSSCNAVFTTVTLAPLFSSARNCSNGSICAIN